MARVLLVDDDQGFLDLYKELLEEEGIEVDTASNGKDSLQFIYEGGYDLVLLDIIMPEMDGISVLKKLKFRAPRVPNKKIVMLTVLDQSDFIKSSLKLGAAGYISKDHGTPENLVDQIIDLINGGEAKTV